MASVPLITAREIPAARAAAQKVVRTHERLAAWLRPGMTLAQIDTFVAKTLDELACRSCFLNYRVKDHPRFPSHACLSLNDCIVHGTAGYYLSPMKLGDVLKIDIGVFFEGWVGDAAWTYVFGEPTPLVRRLTECGKKALALGMEHLRAGVPHLRWSETVQDCVERDYGFHCIRNWGGHSIGKNLLHGPPHLLNHRPAMPGEAAAASEKWRAGTLMAVEPMIGIGTGETYMRPSSVRGLMEWPVFTADRSLSVHYEHDVLITESGPEVLTQGLEQVRDVIV